MVIVMIRVIRVQQGNPRDNGCCAFRGQEVVSTNASRAHGIVRLSVASTHHGLALAIVQEMLVAAVRHAPSGHVAATTAAA